MPNTISEKVLRRRFREQYSKETSLTSKEVMDIWKGTATSKARGRNVSPELLEQRTTITILRMKAKEDSHV